MIDSGEIQRMIENALSQKKDKFVICPFGENGIQTKYILNHCYGIKEEKIIDNKFCKYNREILSVNDLREIDTTGWVILLNSTFPGVNDLLEKAIRKVKNDISIINIMEPLMVEDVSKSDFYHELKKKTRTRKVLDYNLVRCGKMGDGGYIFVDDFSGVGKAYSFGIGNEITWDMDIADKKIDVHMYDPTIERFPAYNPYFHFHRIGLAGKDCKDSGYLSLESILRENGDLNNKNLILKMDIEEFEWEVLENTDEEILDNFLQMSFEFHKLLNAKNEKRVLEVFEKLGHTHQAIWVHANNMGYSAKVEDGILPSLLEMTLVNRKVYRFSDEVIQYPMNLDYPNLAYRKEVILGEW